MAASGRCTELHLPVDSDCAHVQSTTIPYPMATRGTGLHVWQVYKRVDLGKRTEEYQFVGGFDREPDGRLLTPLLQAKPASSGGQWWNL